MTPISRILEDFRILQCFVTAINIYMCLCYADGPIKFWSYIVFCLLLYNFGTALFKNNPCQFRMRTSSLRLMLLLVASQEVLMQQELVGKSCLPVATGQKWLMSQRRIWLFIFLAISFFLFFNIFALSFAYETMYDERLRCSQVYFIMPVQCCKFKLVSFYNYFIIVQCSYYTGKK